MYSFNELHSALDGLGPHISKMRESIYSILAAILHLGNVNFKTDNLGFAQINDGDGSHDALEFAAKLLAINRKYLERVILERTVAVAGNLILYVFSMRWIFQCRFKKLLLFCSHSVQLNDTLAARARDSVIKLIYCELLRFLVETINGPTNPSNISEQYIAMLDIAGFGRLIYRRLIYLI